MISLILIGVCGIALLLTLVLWLRLHPFVALVLVSVLVALVAGLPVALLTKTVEEGLGASLGHIALIVALGAMIGQIVNDSGGAEALARALIARFGSRRIPLALTVAGFLIGIPVFFEVGVVMLMPLAYGMARRSGLLLPAVALPMCMALLAVHALLPPHPGAVAASGLLGADLGRILIFGLPIALLCAVTGFLVARQLGRTDYVLAPEVQAQIDRTPDERTADAADAAPPVGTVMLLIVLPILMILGSTIANLVMGPSPLRPIFTFLGIPFVALLIDLLLGAYLLGARRGWSRERVSQVLAAAIPGVAPVILITGGGAIFAKILVTTGIGDATAGLMRASGLPILLLAFTLTLLIRAVQGPTTVALITVGGLIAPFAIAAHLDANHLALLCLAMGCGGIGMSHINDAGFWIVTRLIGLNTRDGLKTWTLLTTIVAFTGFAITSLFWALI